MSWLSQRSKLSSLLGSKGTIPCVLIPKKDSSKQIHHSSSTTPSQPAVGGSHFIFFFISTITIHYKSNEDRHGTGSPGRRGRRQQRRGWENRRARRPMGTYSFSSLFSLLSSSSHSSSFWLSLLPRSTTMSWVGQDMENTGGARETGTDGRATCAYSVVFL